MKRFLIFISLFFLFLGLSRIGVAVAYNQECISYRDVYHGYPSFP